MLEITKSVAVHFIGIGGIGMSGIAEVLLNLGYQVTGSDVSHSTNVEKLISLGAKIEIGHSESNITNPTVIVFSSAIAKENPELKTAIERKIPIMRRAEMLAELMRLKFGLAIAGTHGKTTTTSMLATILKGALKDPTYIIGGIVKNLGGHASVGEGEYLVAEADESDGSFLLLNPIMSAITNVDYDHLDYYGTQENLVASFLKFANKIPFYGVCALNGHDKTLMDIREQIIKPSITFGIDIETDFCATEVKHNQDNSTFNLLYRGEKVGEFTVNLPGEHNILNALGAISLAKSLDISFDVIANSLKTFEGVGRRFQKIYSDENIVVYDDYAHHPTEITKTLKTLKEIGDGKIIAIFEPHRFSRTKACWNEFLHSFNFADEVYILPVYAASEEPIDGINTDSLVRDINRLHPNLAKAISGYKSMEDLLKKSDSEKRTLITLGAGPISRNINSFIKEKFEV